MTDIVEWLEIEGAACDRLRDETSPYGNRLRAARAKVIRLRAIEAMLREPSEEVVEAVAGAIWGGKNAWRYTFRENLFFEPKARAAIKALADAVLNGDGND